MPMTTVPVPPMPAVPVAVAVAPPSVATRLRLLFFDHGVFVYLVDAAWAIDLCAALPRVVSKLQRVEDEEADS